ncbi:unnamed protein product [Phytophthora fragariaefolia]|uniref:Unnamed protein product n=1 Tax=Phytophthora fragariaefolia TaxID=1490495 RepID=A0A9W6X4N0_9STRA|nr:unnamed protein product [Phytophthora fragariaefolia]
MEETKPPADEEEKQQAAGTQQDTETLKDVEDDGAEETQPSCSTGAAIAPPWEGETAAKTPRDLLADKERTSDWLAARVPQNVEGTQTMPLQVQRGYEAPVAGTDQELAEPVDHPALYEQWPPQLEERRKIWFLPRSSGRRPPAATIGTKQPVVYWMHSALRVTQGNYGLEAAILLSRRLTAPLVVVCLIPSSIIYPVCHSTTASDAYARFSFVELYQQFTQAGVPFYGFTAMEDGPPVPNESQSITFKPNPLYELLDAFSPHAVVTDALFDAPSRSDMMRLSHYLELNRSSCSWSLVSMDSTTCCPAYQLSMKLQSTLERGAEFANEEQFGAEYALFSQARNGTYVFSPLPRVVTQDSIQNQQQPGIMSTVLQKLRLENVNWHAVKAENTQSSSQMRRFSEGEGLQRLSQLLSGSDNQPAIQAELRGGGVLSLMPFIRHGSLFAGYVVRRINDAIASSRIPKTPQERKELAMRKVMRSRAVNHLGKERDYALYLALWCAVNGESKESNGLVQPDIALLSTSEMLLSLRISAPRTSSLYVFVRIEAGISNFLSEYWYFCCFRDTYRYLLPGWALSSAKLGNNSSAQVPNAALYDPYELESARTKDLYWNEIQKFLVEQQYLHPLLIVYWAYRTIESLVSQCVLGSKSSPDAAFIVWKMLFRLGSTESGTTGATNGRNTPKQEDLREFQLVLERELASQPKLQLHP